MRPPQPPEADLVSKAWSGQCLDQCAAFLGASDCSDSGQNRVMSFPARDNWCQVFSSTRSLVTIHISAFQPKPPTLSF